MPRFGLPLTPQARLSQTRRRAGWLVLLAFFVGMVTTDATNMDHIRPMEPTAITQVDEPSSSLLELANDEIQDTTQWLQSNPLVTIIADVGGATSFVVLIYQSAMSRFVSSSSSTSLTAEQVTELRCWTIVRQLVEQFDLLKKSNASRSAIESKAAEVTAKITECGKMAPA